MIEDGEEQNSPATGNVAEDGPKRKKKKKKKRKLEEVERVEQVPVDTVAAELSQSKKTKKKKKKKKKNSSAPDNGSETGSLDSSVQGVKAAKEQHIAPPSPSKKRKLSTGSAAAAAAAALPPSVAAWRAERRIKLTDEGAAPFPPHQTFGEAGFPPEVLGGCEGFTAPTPIQAQCWPILSAGRDLIGVAETGSGKTLAFSLPALARIHRELGGGKALSRQRPGPLMLVICPTRELAQQCAAVIETAGAGAGLRSVCVYGGVPKHEQKRKLQNAQGGAHVVVATPGRLRDLMSENAVDLGRVAHLVLDEADRMLDLGFEQDMRAIIGACPAPGAAAGGRRTAMFSATWPREVRELAAEFLDRPVRVTIGGSKLAANARVSQCVEVMGERERGARLQQLLERYHDGRNRVIVFGLYKKECSRLEGDLRRAGWKVGAIHGDKGQGAREAALEDFRQQKVPILIATDVAARGLDIPDVEVVINYSFPLTIEDYVHRIGRTGRAGKSGVSHTLFHEGDKARAGELVNVLTKAGAEVPAALLKFGTHVKKKEHKLYGAFAKDVDLTKKATKITFDDSDSD
uniref:RNA helicase n=1 Tax=Heterosigma akashiwo TaxID=2829 RepID=A0A7S3XUU1_HETAK